jgi:hypothetical protein
MAWTLRSKSFSFLSIQENSSQWKLGIYSTPWHCILSILNLVRNFCSIIGIRRVCRYQGGNQNLYIEKEQTTQWPKEKSFSFLSIQENSYQWKLGIYSTPWHCCNIILNYVLKVYGAYSCWWCWMAHAPYTAIWLLVPWAICYIVIFVNHIINFKLSQKFLFDIWYKKSLQIPRG